MNEYDERAIAASKRAKKAIDALQSRRTESISNSLFLLVIGAIFGGITASIFWIAFFLIAQ